MRTKQEDKGRVYCSISKQNCLCNHLTFLCKVDASWSGGWEGILLRSHTRTTPTSAPERWATWLTFCKADPPRKLPDSAVEAWAASMTYSDQAKHMDKKVPSPYVLQKPTTRFMLLEINEKREFNSISTTPLLCFSSTFLVQQHVEVRGLWSLLRI